MVYEFESEQQRKWFFAALKSGIIYEWLPRTEPRDTYRPRHVTPQPSLTNIITNSDEWQEYLRILDELPWYIEWLADYRTTIMLSTALATLLTIGSIQSGFLAKWLAESRGAVIKADFMKAVQTVEFGDEATFANVIKQFTPMLKKVQPQLSYARWHTDLTSFGNWCMYNLPKTGFAAGGFG